MSLSANTLLNRFVIRSKFRHMQVLIKLAEIGSMRRTAEAVNMTQPAITQLVAELEKLLETKLFLRHAKGVEPTLATLELLPVAKRILNALEDGAENIANHLKNHGGIVRVSASPAAVGAIIQGKLAKFAARFPELNVQIVQMDDTAPLYGIVEDAVDVVCTRQPNVVPEGWEFEKLFDDQLVVVCGKSHSLANFDKIDIDNLGKSKWLINRIGSVSRKRFEEIFERQNWPTSCRCEITTHIPELTKELLLTGDYLSILPHSVAIPWLKSEEIRLLETDMQQTLAPLGFLWSPEHAGTATHAFVKELRKDMQQT
jgi:DNA-binding transcriptional LysR family regulator